MKTVLPVLLVSAVALGACSGVKEKLGLERNAPDEFAVLERAPLTMPPNFTLQPPTPGTKRHQEQAAVSAKGLVLGSESSAPKAPASLSEQMLLNKAGAARANPAIRQQLTAPDSDKADQTVAQKLGITSGDTKGKALDPAEEAARLKKSNVKTPPVSSVKNAQ